VKTRLQLTAFIVSVSATLALPLGAAGHESGTSNEAHAGAGKHSSRPGGLLNKSPLSRGGPHGRPVAKADDKPKADKPKPDYKPKPEKNAKGEEKAKGDGQSALPAPNAPTVGEDLNVVLKGGTVRIKLPGSGAFVVLGADASIPMGSVVNAKAGTVTLTSAHDNHGVTQSAAFKGSIFKVTQKQAAKPITILRLRGGNFSSCPSLGAKAGAATIASVRRGARRSLWGSGHGNFRTIGRHGAATVRGTIWRTTDRCDGTLVRVRRGLVKVRDFSTHKNVFVSAGHHHLARAQPRHSSGR
jgi:hypothetical protein